MKSPSETYLVGSNRRKLLGEKSNGVDAVDAILFFI
jgi:hypothetical protein